MGARSLEFAMKTRIGRLASRAIGGEKRGKGFKGA
jgi:hypothetical protein